jgi:hypothetical protein
MCLGVSYEKKKYIFSTLHKSLEDKNEFEVCNVASPDPYVLGRPDPDPLVRGMDPDPSIIMQK